MKFQIYINSVWCNASDSNTQDVVNATPGIEHLPHVGIKQSGVGCDQYFWSLEEYYNPKRLDLNP